MFVRLESVGSLTREDGTLKEAELEGADAEAEGGEASDVGEERVGHGLRSLVVDDDTPSAMHWWSLSTTERRPARAAPW